MEGDKEKIRELEKENKELKKLLKTYISVKRIPICFICGKYIDGNTERIKIILNKRNPYYNTILGENYCVKCWDDNKHKLKWKEGK